MRDEKLEPLPRMVGEADIRLVRALAEKAGGNPTIVEFGPWLGALSVELAAAGDLHVVDNFVWTKDHDRRVPGLFKPGESFQPAFERSLDLRGLRAVCHRSEFDDFAWTGPPIDLCVIDSPKTPDALHGILCRVAPHLADDACLVVKNGLNVKLPGMMSYLEHLVLKDMLVLDRTWEVLKSNCAVLRRGAQIHALADVAADALDFGGVAASEASTGDGLSDGLFRLARIAQTVDALDWQRAYAILSGLPPERRHWIEWQRLEPTLANAQSRQPDALATFTEIVSVHNDAALARKGIRAFHRSASMALRAYWLNNADKPWRGEAFCPEILQRAQEFGYMNWASKIRDFVRGKDVLDVGCGPGLHGLGFLAAGAKSYIGMDPIIRLDSDRVKNLAAKTKDRFGWTPADMDTRIAPWHVSAAPIEDHARDRAFDIATLHNVTEHLHELEKVFAEIAIRLRPGGTILYNHHNFYTWNGHHRPPKTVSALDLSDPSQREMVDWGHVEYDPAPDHYIARGLNRIRLDDIIEITRRYFDIEEMEEVPSSRETGHDRLTDEIRSRYPYLTDRDFLTQNLFCVARLRA